MARTAVARDSRVRTTPLICGRHASVATKILICCLALNRQPRFFAISCKPKNVVVRLDLNASGSIAASHFTRVTSPEGFCRRLHDHPRIEWDDLAARDAPPAAPPASIDHHVW